MIVEWLDGSAAVAKAIMANGGDVGMAYSRPVASGESKTGGGGKAATSIVDVDDDDFGRPSSDDDSDSDESSSDSDSNDDSDSSDESTTSSGWGKRGPRPRVRSRTPMTDLYRAMQDTPESLKRVEDLSADAAELLQVGGEGMATPALQLRALTQIWTKCDEGMKGYLDVSKGEFARILEAFEIAMNPAMWRRAIYEIDPHGRGRIYLKAFLIWWHKLPLLALHNTFYACVREIKRAKKREDALIRVHGSTPRIGQYRAVAPLQLN